MQKTFSAAKNKLRSRRFQAASVGAPIFAALLGLAFVGPQADVSGAPATVPHVAANATTVPAVRQTVPAVMRETPEEPEVFANGADGLSPVVLRAALDAVAGAQARGITGRNDLLTVIDYSLPSTQPRLWVLDLAKGNVLFHELVAHGAGSGDNYATQFSNVNDSRQTSLGLFLTGGTYEGGNGYSLKLRGLDAGLNDLAETRHIVMHGAWYVSPEHARSHGRLGRSWGCPALSEQIAPQVIDTIKGGSFVYSYFPTAPGAGTLATTSSRAVK
jgi:hypothetical protein